VTLLAEALFQISVQDVLEIEPDGSPEPDVAILRFRADYYGALHPNGGDALLVIEVGDTERNPREKIRDYMRDVGTEWRFRASPPGEDAGPLSPKDRETPPVAPEIVVEVLSPDDRPKDVDEKRRVYFAWGVTLELIADLDGRCVYVYDNLGRHEHVDASVETYSPAIDPDLVLPLRAMFAELDRIDDLDESPE
jgi:Uma2 family endonuclease